MLFYTIFLVAMFTAIVLIPPLTYIYTKFNLVDIPSPRKVHSVPVPRVGGIAIVIATIIPVVWWVNTETPIIGVLSGVAILFVLGVIDDAKNLSYKSKFLFQFLSIALIFFSGFIDVNASHYVVNELAPNIFLFLVYFIFILGVTNAINLSDGLDGLAGGEALLSFSIIGLLAYEINNITVVLFILAIIGSVFGFLRFNTYPAKIFMGDTGSLFLGFILGVLSVALTYSADNAYAKALPLLIVGLPIFDTIMVMCIRVFNRQSPFNADRNHLHHKLLDHGFKHYQSVLIIYSIQSIYILTAYFMRYDTEVNIIFAFCVISSFVFLVGIAHKKVNRENNVRNSIVYNKLISLRSSIVNKEDIILTLLALLLIIYIFTSVINIYSADVDILFLLIIISLLPIIGMIFYRKKPCNWLERVAIHVMIVLSIYFGTQNIDNSQVNNFHLTVLGLCIALIAILFVGGGEKRFVGSPLDFLLVATAIVIPNLPRSPVSDPALSILVIKLIILFYCIEYVLFNIKAKWWAVRTILMLSACVPIFINYYR